MVLDRVTHRYPGPSGRAGPPALDDVSLVIERDDFLGVIGPNGGGKTTLLKIILGLLEPRSGEVRVFGRPPREIRHRVGYVPQRARLDTSVPATVLDVVLTGRLARSGWGLIFGRRHRDGARDALARTDALDLADRPVGSLSGGQRQRVLIARALASDAELLLLDEPTAGVDQAVERDLLNLLHRLNESMPIVMVSHDIAVVSTHLKRVACLNRRLSCHLPHEINDETITSMYRGGVRAIHHDRCPLGDPGCGHGCEEHRPAETAHHETNRR